jgi:hypothetical protein
LECTQKEHEAEEVTGFTAAGWYNSQDMLAIDRFAKAFKDVVMEVVW